MTKLITRSDFDGLFCAVLIKQVEKIGEVVFAHPKDVQDGKLEIQQGDFITNLPYHPNCGAWFDHHSSEAQRTQSPKVKGELKLAPSAAQVVYDYYGGEQTFPKYRELIDIVNRVDSAQLSLEEITNPKDWILLSYIMDSRTGLGKYHHFRISNYELMTKFIDFIQTKNVEEILANADVKERLDLYQEQQEAFIQHIKDTSRENQNVLISDVRDIEEIPVGNRFMAYALYPNVNASVRIANGVQKQNVVVAVAHSIINRTCQTDVGGLMAKYGGGGHKGAGTCQLPHDTAQAKIEEIVNTLIQHG